MPNFVDNDNPTRQIEQGNLQVCETFKWVKKHDPSLTPAMKVAVENVVSERNLMKKRSHQKNCFLHA